MSTAVGYAMESLHSFLMHLLIFISIFVIVLLAFSTGLAELFKYIIYSLSGSHYQWAAAHIKSLEMDDESDKLITAASILHHGKAIETIWTTIPCAILAAIALPSYDVAYCAEGILAPELRVHVIANQWYWQYEYFFAYTATPTIKASNEITDGIHLYILPSSWFNYSIDTLESFIKDPNLMHSELKGQALVKSEFIQKKLTTESYIVTALELTTKELRLLQTTQALVLPINTKIGLSVTSNDVLHSFAVPSFGIKVDAIPGRINYVNLFLDREAHAFGQCSEICGVNHGFMPNEIKAVEPNKFLAWANSFADNKYEAVQTLTEVKPLEDWYSLMHVLETLIEHKKKTL
jgi:heme/copper-type cytochrome/quinol oxidase subunit 2